MSKTVIAEGKTLNEAIDNGLKALNCKRSDVEVKEVKDTDKKMFYSILAPRKVKVELILNNEKNDEYKVTDEDLKNASDTLGRFLDKFKVNFKDLDYKIEVKDDIIHVDFIGDDSLNLIGYRGEVLNSLQTILIAVLKKEKDSRVKLYLNVGDYREKRNDILKELARKIEAEVLKNRKKRVLEPMSAYERKVIHTELQNSDKVITFSIGEEPHRRLVIDLK